MWASGVGLSIAAALAVLILVKLLIVLMQFIADARHGADAIENDEDRGTDDE